MPKLGRTIVFPLLGISLFLAGWLSGQQSGRIEQSVVHAVAWTAADGLAPQALEEFKKGTAVFAAAVPGLERAWVGELRRPLTVGDTERTHGLVFEFKDLKSREDYSTHPQRDQWIKSFNGVRSPGATVFDVIGQ